MLHVVQSFGEELPNACTNTAHEVYAVLDALLVKYGTFYYITERASRVLRLGMQFFEKLETLNASCLVATASRCSLSFL